MFHKHIVNDVFQHEWESIQPIWLITDVGGVFRFETVSSIPRGLCLTGESGGGNVDLQACENGNAQRAWLLDGDNASLYMILVKSTGECVTVVDGPLENVAGLFFRRARNWRVNAGSSPSLTPEVRPDRHRSHPIDRRLTTSSATKSVATVRVCASLEDQSGVQPEVRVRKPRLFCNPVAKTVIDTREITDVNGPASHLTWYGIHDRQRRKNLVSLENQFDLQTLAVRRAELLCVPSEKVSVGPTEKKDCPQI